MSSMCATSSPTHLARPVSVENLWSTVAACERVHVSVSSPSCVYLCNVHQLALQQSHWCCGCHFSQFRASSYVVRLDELHCGRVLNI